MSIGGVGIDDFGFWILKGRDDPARSSVIPAEWRQGHLVKRRALEEEKEEDLASGGRR